MRRTSNSTVFVVFCLALAGAPPGARGQSELRVRSREGLTSLPLISERLRIAVDRQYARTAVRQVYHNSSGQRLEGRFVLRTGADTRVHGYAYYNGEERIVGEVFEKDTAAAVYEQVTGLDRDPGLLEQTGAGAFSFRVFPIAAGEHKRIEVEYGGYLVRRGQVVELRAPLSSDRAEINLELADDRPITRIESPTHRLEVRRAGTQRAQVSAAARAGIDEFVLRYHLDEPPWTVSAQVHRDPGHDGYLLLRLAAPAVPRSAVAAKDVTLVLDRSGSMSGEPIEHARRAAANIIGRLAAGDRVNVMAFDDDVVSLYPAPRPVNDAVRGEALAFVSQLRDEGGTNLARALEHALAAQTADERPDVVLFLTDGQSDAQAALRAVAGDRGDVRVFTVGVGAGVEKPLLSRLATSKRGRFVFIDSPGAIETRMAALYEQIAEPVLVDVRIEVEGGRLFRTYPRTLPDLFRDDELRVASRFAGAGPMVVTVRGVHAGRPVAHTVEVAAPVPARRPWVGRLWAEARVDDLLEEIALVGETDELKTEVIDLAVAYNFATRYTSFLAIPERELTDAAAQTLAGARARKQTILAAHKDAVALSRTAMPPGDPVLSVRAPADAQQVTAYLPFGLVQDLRYDRNSEHWSVRFLVPKGVADGVYEVRVVIVHADGTVELAAVPYTIDSAAPDFEVAVTSTGSGVSIAVSTDEPAQLVTAALVGDAAVRTQLAAQGGGRSFAGELALGSGTHQLRVVVADLARNESERIVTVVVP
jgi:Ca-activated chloride channel homolog